MSKMIQVRNVPDRLHRALLRRARLRGVSLTAYVEDVLERDVATPSREEILAAARRREPIELGVSSAELIRRDREERERHLLSLSTLPRSSSSR
jgi:plasmid stability protein